MPVLEQLKQSEKYSMKQPYPACLKKPDTVFISNPNIQDSGRFLFLLKR